MGDFYLIARPSDLQTRTDIVNKFAVYVNDFSLYFIDISSPNSGGYRNVVASIPLENMIVQLKDYEGISKYGKCCSFLADGSGIKYVGGSLDELARMKGMNGNLANKRLDPDLYSLISQLSNLSLF